MHFGMRIAVLPACVLLFWSCQHTAQEQGKGAIVLGDSATIITETDPQYLSNFVQDLKPVPLSEPAPDRPKPAPQTQDTAAALPAPSATAASSPAAAPPATAGKGLDVDFKEIRVFIPGIETTNFSSSVQNSKSAAYMLTSGDLADSRLVITGDAVIEKVNQRYETIMVLNESGNRLPLESLKYNSGWKTLKTARGSNEVQLKELGGKTLGRSKATSQTIRNAVTRAVKDQRVSAAQQKKYQDAARNIRNTGQAPLETALRTVIWQISGKDKQGKAFTKELRIDLPA